MSFERDGVTFRFTTEEAEAERQKFITEQVLPAALEYFAKEPDVTHVSCFVAQYWNDEGLDDLYVRVRPSKEDAESPDEVEAALQATDDLQSLFAAYCEYGDQNETDSRNYRLFATITRAGEVIRAKQVRPGSTACNASTTTTRTRRARRMCSSKHSSRSTRGPRPSPRRRAGHWGG